MRRVKQAPPALTGCSASSYGGQAPPSLTDSSASSFGGQVVRWLTVLGVAGILFMSGGCGGGGGDDDNVSGTGTDTGTGTGTDTTPDPFRFNPHVSNFLGNPTTSLTTITVTGIDAPAPISISGGGTYSIDDGPFTSQTGTVNSGQRVSVRHTTATTHSTVTTSTLTIGGVSAPFITITGPPEGADILPDPFSFMPRTSVPPGTFATSAPITITGIDHPTFILIQGGTYSIDGGPFTPNAGLVSNGQTVTAGHTSAAGVNSSNMTTVTVGHRYSNFITTTGTAVGKDTTPNTFSFTPQTGVRPNWLIASNRVQITGIDAPTPISVTGGTYSYDGITFTSQPGTIENWNAVTVRQTSSAKPNTVTTTTLTIGGVSVPFTTTTSDAAVDNRPNDFTFMAQTEVPLNSAVISNAITVSGIDAPAQIYTTDGAYSINGGAYTFSPGTVTNGQTVTVRHTSSGANNTLTTTTLTIGGVSAAFTSTTKVFVDTVAIRYETRCASCHKLGTLDTTGTAPDLLTTTLMREKFLFQTSGHSGVTLTYEEISGLEEYFRHFR